MIFTAQILIDVKSMPKGDRSGLSDFNNLVPENKKVPLIGIGEIKLFPPQKINSPVPILETHLMLSRERLKGNSSRNYLLIGVDGYVWVEDTPNDKIYLAAKALSDFILIDAREHYYRRYIASFES